MQLEKTDFPQGRLTTVRGISGEVTGPFVTTELHIGRRPEAISLARYRAIPANGNRNNLRGRYLCSFSDGSEFIIEKVGKPRNAQGELDPLGTYRLVVDSITTSSSFCVLSYESGSDTDAVSPGGRKKETFRVQIKDDASTRRATIEYLSTKSWDNHDSGAGDVMGRVRAGAPSVTVRTEFFKPEKGRYLHPTENRPITHYEAAKLQGFPDNFRWCGSKTDIAKQIGNAVPVPLGLKIAESIHAYLRPNTV
ncbi:DNA cytosine methyltransferase [Paeniglutamicibacter psychrophenolicus]|uniref:DNA (cytosine-5-)-methyltransferase n=1 Tax=Paeniglutamicibacter psychrophenolicus TaxID=257454 RepID=A0ABS4W9R8_9MICC|nr:site-specific DNA-cytosine methylase [Paeniglutamicibacter psychrophenolicus]